MGETQTSIHDDLARRLVAKPFAPFVIETAGGERYEVVRKFQAAVGERTVVVLPPAGDGARVLRIDAIRSLEPS